MAVDNLSVKISAATRNFERKMSGASDAVGEFGRGTVQASSGVQLLQNRVDELEDELSSVDREASSANRSLSLMTASTTSLSAATSALSTAALPGLVASLGTLATVAFPLAATFGGLAVALGGVATGAAAVVGSGLLAYGQELGAENARRLSQVRQQIAELERLKSTEEGLSVVEQERLTNLQDRADKLEEQTGIMGGLKSAFSDLASELKPLITDLGEAFVPLIKDIIEDIPSLARNIINAIMPLEQFANALRDLWGIAQEALPRIIGRMVDFGREALPAVVRISDNIASGFVPAMEGLMDVTDETLPLLTQFADPILNVLPPLTEFGLEVLELVDGPLKGLLELGADALNWFNDLPDIVQNGAIALTVLSSALIAVAPAISAIGGLVGILSPVIGVLGTLSAKALAVAGAFGIGLSAIIALEGAIAALIALNWDIVTDWFNRATTILGNFADKLQPTFRQLVGVFRDAKPEMMAFAQAANNLFRGALQSVIDVMIVFSRAIHNNLTIPIARELVDALDGRVQPLFRELTTLMENIGRAASRAGDLLISGWQRVDHIVVPILEKIANLITDSVVFGFRSAFDIAQVLLNLLNGDFASALDVTESGLSDIVSAAKNLATTLTTALRQAVLQATESFGTLLAQRLNESIPNQVMGVNLPNDPINMPDLTQSTQTQTPTPTVTPTPSRSQRGRATGETRVNVEVRGDTEIVEDVATSVIRDSERQTNRQIGRDTIPQ